MAVILSANYILREHLPLRMADKSVLILKKTFVGKFNTSAFRN
jgi:hypothetical protein